MLQVRKLVLAVAAATAMSSGAVHALGLGEITVKSALDQPLVAEVELLETQGLGLDEIRSRLASVEEFGQAGVDRPFFLTNLQFTPVLQGGRNYVRITSNQPVREPYLSFLMEVYWPNGKLLKEYTLLLDPPMYTPQQVVYNTAPATASRQATPPVTRPQARQTRARQSATQSQSAKEGEYRVRKNDTLWEIALRAGGRGQSVHQTMLAIQDLNPDAFIDGNINRLKSNQLLKLPSAEQISQRSVQQAVNEVKAQDQAWRTGRRPQPQLDARQRSSADPAPVKAEQQDSLRLVAADTGQAQVGSDSGAADALQDQLAQIKEKLDSVVRENQELSSRLSDLDSQNEKLQRLLELKNEQLASLQNLEAQPAAEPVAEPAEQAPAAQPEQAAENSPQGSAEIAQDAEADSFSMAATPEEQAVAPVLSVDEQIAEELRAQEQQAAEQASAAEIAQPEPVIESEQPAGPYAFLDELLQNPMFLPAAGAGAAGLLLLLLLLRRKNRTQSDADGSDVQGDADSFVGLQDEPLVDGLDDDFLSTDSSVEDAPAFAGAGSPGALAEAEAHINFGRFSQAAQVLLNAIDREPQREDLRIKLLEVYADLEDQHSFVDQFEELVAMGTAQDKLDSLRQRYPHFLSSAPLASDLASLPEIEGLPGLDDQPAAGLADEGFPELDELDELLGSGLTETLDDQWASTFEQDETAGVAQVAETEAGIEQPQPDVLADEPPAVPALEMPGLDMPEAEADVGVDLDFVLDGLDATEEQPEVAQSLEDELNLDDLDLDFDLSLPLDEAPDAPETSALELSAELAAPEVTAAELDNAPDMPSTPETLDIPAMPQAEAAPMADFDLDSELQAFSAELDNALDMATETSPEAAQSTDVADLAGLDLDLDLDNLLGLADTAAATEQDMDSPTGAALDFELDDLLGNKAPTTDSLDAALEDFGFEQGLPEQSTPELPAAEQGGALSALEQDLGEDLDFLSDTDETTTKLDLALALTEMGDVEGARDILEEVVREGDAQQQEQARDMLDKLS